MHTWILVTTLGYCIDSFDLLSKKIKIKSFSSKKKLFKNCVPNFGCKCSQSFTS